MSADNTVAILITRGEEPETLEFRVVHAQAIENIWWDPELGEYRVGVLNSEETRKYFGDAPVFTKSTDAWACAQRIHDQVISDFGIVEYGIKELDCSDVAFPKAPEEEAPESAVA